MSTVRRSIRASLFALLTLAAAAPLRAQESVYLKGGWLFDAVGNDRVRNPGILVSGGTIIRIGDATPQEIAAARTVDVADSETILPGLIDVHGHYSMTLLNRRRDEVNVYPTVYLANGVTTTFSAGEYNPDEMAALHERVERGEVPGPRMVLSGPYWGSARAGWNANQSVEELNADVDKWAARGIRSFKVKGINARLLKPLLDRAHWHGITVTAHLGSGFGDSVNPRDAILMGLDRVDHFMGGDAMPPTREAYESLENLDVNSQAVKDIFKLFIDRHVYYNTTLSTYGHVANPEPDVFGYWFDEPTLLTPYVRSVHATNPPRPYSEQFRRIYEKKKLEIKAFYDAGGGDLITLATDAPSNGQRFSGFNAHRELHALVKSGIPPAAALKIGTINGARALNMGDRLGSIERGKWADMFIVRGNPLQDITTTHNVRLVLRSGHVYDAKALLDSVVGKIGPSSAADAIAKGWARAPQSSTDN